MQPQWQSLERLVPDGSIGVTKRQQVPTGVNKSTRARALIHNRQSALIQPDLTHPAPGRACWPQAGNQG